MDAQYEPALLDRDRKKPAVWVFKVAEIQNKKGVDRKTNPPAITLNITFWNNNSISMDNFYVSKS